MPDVDALDAKTGQPVTLPQEAVASQYAKGAIYFAPGTRVPVILNGQPGTVPEHELDDAIHEGGATFNYDPAGATKAAAAGAARGASFGLTDWLAIEEGKLLKGHEGGEYVRKTLEGLRDEHPSASTTGEVGGAIASMFIPGGAEVDAARAGEVGLDAAQGAGAAADAAGAARALPGGAAPTLSPLEAAEQARAGAEAMSAAQAGAQIRQASDAASAVAEADAASGRTVGSTLGSLLRHANPNNAIGTVGGAAENAVTRLFGEGAVARGAGTLARFATEGAVVDYANALDESELGDTNLTGEAILASLEHGALYGSALGLVGVAGEKVLTGAGRLAARVAEGRLGGSAGQFRKGLERWGPGSLGMRSLEEGIETPFATGAEKYERAQAVVQRDGSLLDSIAREADDKYQGMEAHASRQAMHEAIDRAAEDGRMAGGNLDLLSQKLKGEYDKAIGWHADPAPLARLPENAADELYTQAWQEEAKRGLLAPDTPAPRPVTAGQVRARYRELLDGEGLAPKLEKPPKGIPREAIEQRRAILVRRMQTSTDLADRQRIGVELATPGALEASVRQEMDAGIAARNARRAELQTKAADDLNTQYAQQKDTWDRAMKRHEELRAQSAQKVSEAQGQRDKTYAHMVSAIRRGNGELRVPFTKVREFRAKLDDIIPYNRPTDAISNAAIEMKRQARQALEGHLERSLDKAATRSGNQEILARYVHAKARYGQAKDIEKMLERQRARDVSRFGREVFGHHGGLIGHALAGGMFGHPVAGAAVGIGKKYAPSVAAWAAHKVSRFAEMKALRADVMVAMRKSARAAAAGREVERLSSVAVPDLAPHELRANAAEAMLAVMKTAKGADLAARLAALDPNMPILAPKAAAAAEGAARRALAWMVSTIPARIQAAIAQGHKPTGRDLSDTEARNFLEGAAVAHDPRFATDALAHGQLTPAAAAGWKAVWPGLHAQSVATAQRQAQLDHDSFDKLPMGRRNQLSSVGVHAMPTSPPGMTLALQRSAAALTAAGAAKQQPAGQVHASSGLAKMGSSSMMQTMSDTLEANSPGRRKNAG
jgi:hypothetical protein